MPDTEQPDYDSLYVNVVVYGGAHVPSVIRQMSALAKRMGVSVWAELNGVRTLVRVDDDPAEVGKAWEAALNSKHHPKIASVR